MSCYVLVRFFLENYSITNVLGRAYIREQNIQQKNEEENTESG